MCNKTNVLKIFYLFSFLGLLVFGTVCTEANELHRENQALIEKFSQSQKKAVEFEKQYRLDVKPGPIITVVNQMCVECHKILMPALVMEWERSRHAKEGIGCVLIVTRLIRKR